MDGSVRYVVDAPRSSELVTWLGFNGVSPCDVPYPSEVFVETADGLEWFIRYQAYARSESGAIRYDPRSDRFQYEERQVLLAYDPPMWWLKDAAPPTGGGGTASASAMATCSGADGDQNVADGAFNCD